MSGFDVSRADDRRSSAIAVFASLALSAVLLTTLITSRAAHSAAAPVEVAENTSVSIAMPESGSALMVAAIAVNLPVEPTLAPAHIYPSLVTIVDRPNLVALQHDAFTSCEDCPSFRSVTRRVPRGGTLAGVLDDAGINRVDAARAIASMRDIYDLRHLRAGKQISIYLATAEVEGETSTWLNGVSFRPDIERSITVARTHDDGFSARQTISQFDSELVRARGSITSSLYVDALAAGATDRIVVELAGILAYAIDFQRSIREGDEFDILFERFIDEEGDVARTGDILFTSYDGRGDIKEFYRFETPDGIVGYYSGDGESAERLLMLTPINGARLSSHFSRARRHPILGYTRRHNGTDFAAPRGTPILASGNGVVERADRYSSFGNYTRLRHANGFQTMYAHQSRFARGIRVGTRVTQGQVIGYVGTTGRSTGPHLHYEVHLNGSPVNPMTLDLPTGRALNADEIPLFEAERDRINALRDAAASAARDASPQIADAGNGAP